MGHLISLALAGAILAGCAGFQAEALGRAQKVSDDAARALVAAPCAMTVGAYNRLPQTSRIAVDLLCGGNALQRLRGFSSTSR